MSSTPSLCFSDARAALDALHPDEPLYCLRTAVMDNIAGIFINHFHGNTLYAVKCNPHPEILKALYKAGIRHFDTASIAEIKLVKSLFPDAHCAFMHPVKSRDAIRIAYTDYGIRHFVIDSLDELTKIENETNHARDLTIFIRFKTDSHGAVQYELSTKFGADIDTTLQLMKIVAARYVQWGLTFHVGTQCNNPTAYQDAIARLQHLLTRSQLTPTHIDIGGGFPAYYNEIPIPPLPEFFRIINESLSALALPEHTVFSCEPGRALVADACSVLTEVQLRKNQCLYINDGSYGGLSQLPFLPKDIHLPARLWRRDERKAQQSIYFDLYGPTCDSWDVIPKALLIPNDVQEGDWLEVGLCGAYSYSIATQFNGFHSQKMVCVEDALFYKTKALV